MAFCKWRLIAFSIWVVHMGTVRAGAGEDFSNNLFSDLAPLLSLFGEQFAKQYMSESLGWLDHVIFAMAPLGILTAISGAIRVGGPAWMRAVIGRARENRATVELELMSSTSHEVCELWNGQGLVRTMGRPEVQQIIYFEELKNDLETFGLHTMKTAKEDKRLQLEQREMRDPLTTVLFRPLQRKDSEEAGARDQARLEPLDLAAPNISLNLHGGSGVWDLIGVTLCGVVLQLGMLIFSALTVYHPTFKLAFLKDGKPVSKYAYPTMAGGTILLTVGMVICAAVIEKSTQEKVLVRKEKIDSADGSASSNSPFSARLLWLQRHHIVSDQAFDATVIFRPPKNGIATVDRIITSRRAPESISGKKTVSMIPQKICTSTTEAFTLLGVLCGLIGFILQFQGFRGLSWVVSIAQLISIGLMTALRAWLRRHLAASPIPKRVPPEHEMDWLALWFARRLGKRFHDRAAGWPEERGALEDEATKFKQYLREAYKNEQDAGIMGPVEPISKVRKLWEADIWRVDIYWTPLIERLFFRVISNSALVQRSHDTVRDKTSIAGGTLQGSGITDSNNLAVIENQMIQPQVVLSIRRRLGQLVKWPGRTVAPSISLARAVSTTLNKFLMVPSSGETFCWSVKAQVQFGVDVGKVDLITFHASKNSAGWKVDETEIEAALSLWMYHIHEMEEMSRDSGSGAITLPNEGEKYFGVSDLSHRIVRLLGPDEAGQLRAISWWIGGDIQHQISSQKGGSAMKQIFGQLAPDSPKGSPRFRGPIGLAGFSQSTVPGVATGNSTVPDSVLTIESIGTLESLLAQHFFTIFMWTVVKDRGFKMDSGSADTAIAAFNRFRIEDPDSLLSIRLDNPFLAGVARGIEETGLCNLQDAYLCIVPALSSANALPVLEVIDFVREQAKNAERLGQWATVAPVYLRLFQDSKPWGDTNPFFLRATAVLIETLLSVLDITHRQTRQQNQMHTVVEGLRTLQSQIEGELKNMNANILQRFARLHEVQGRFEDVKQMWEVFGIKELGVSKHQAGEGNNSQRTAAEPVIENIFIKPVKLSFSQSIPIDRNLYITALGLQLDPQQKKTINPNEVIDILGWSPLHYAVILPDEVASKAKIRELLHHGADPNNPDITGQTPLHHAIAITAKPRVGQSDLHSTSNMGKVMAMIRGGADINRCARNGKSPLHCAAERGSSAIVGFLLRAGAAVDILDHFRQTPLHLAAFEGYQLIVSALLEKGAFAGSRDQEERTPLHLSVMAGHCEIVDQLLDKMDEEDIMDTPGMGFGGSLMDALAIGGKRYLLDTILGLVADRKFVLHDDYAARAYLHAVQWNKSELVGAWLQINGSLTMAQARCSRNEDGLNALHLASAQGYYDLLTLLIPQGDVGLQEKTNSGDTALHLAVRKLHNRNDVVQTLLKAGIDIHAQNELGETVLHVAAVNGAPCSLVQELLDAGCNSNVGAKTKSGDTALHLALRYGHQHVLKLLLDARIDVGVANELGETAIHVAAAMHDDRALDLQQLLIAGSSAAVLGAQCQSGDTALHLAVRHGKNEMVQEILTQSRTILTHIFGVGINFNINTQNSSGDTALHMAAVSDNAPIIHKLLDAGADTRITNNTGATALKVAMKTQCWSVASELDRFTSSALGLDVISQAAPAGPTRLITLKRKGLFLAAKHAYGYGDVLEQLRTVDTAQAMDPDLVGIDINGVVEGVRGWTTLHTATAHGHTDIVTLLLERGADRFQSAEDGQVALHIAAAYGYHGILKLLIEYRDVGQRGYSAEGESYDDWNLRHMLSADVMGWNALHTAAANGHCDVVETLLAALARSRSGTSSSPSPRGLWFRIFGTKPQIPAGGDDVNIPDILISGVIDDRRPGHNVSSTSRIRGVTALHLAALHRRDNVIQMLLQYYPGVLSEGRESPVIVNSRLAFSVLHAGVLGGCDEVVERLLEAGSEVNIAAAALDIEYIRQMDRECLFESSYWVMREDGYTPLHLAAVQGYTTIVSELLNKGADVNASTRSGWTALYCAAQGGREDVVRILEQEIVGSSRPAGGGTRAGITSTSTAQSTTPKDRHDRDRDRNMGSPRHTTMAERGKWRGMGRSRSIS